MVQYQAKDRPLHFPPYNADDAAYYCTPRNRASQLLSWSVSALIGLSELGTGRQNREMQAMHYQINIYVHAITRNRSII